MLSNSVVFMCKPKYTSWALEELLIPWIHYIPINNDLNDIELKVQWMLQNKELSKRISYRAKLWILDLMYHKDSIIENEIINNEILYRYKQHFQLSSDLII